MYKTPREKLRNYVNNGTWRTECGFITTKSGEPVNLNAEYIKSKQSTELLLLDCYKRAELKYGDECRDKLWTQIAPTSQKLLDECY